MVNQKTSQFSPVIFKPETNIKVLMNFSPRNWIVAMNRLVVLFSFQGYLYFTNIWACTTNRTSGRKDGQILPWSQDWLCSEGAGRWETGARKKMLKVERPLQTVEHCWYWICIVPFVKNYAYRRKSLELLFSITIGIVFYYPRFSANLRDWLT